MSPTDADRFRHMLDAARLASNFARGRQRTDLDSDVMFQFALIRAVEIIGEAASRLPEPTRVAYPEVPWAAIIGMRNRLAHGYFDVDLNILWTTVVAHVPALIATLEAALFGAPQHGFLQGRHRSAKIYFSAERIPAAVSSEVNSIQWIAVARGGCMQCSTGGVLRPGRCRRPQQPFAAPDTHDADAQRVPTIDDPEGRVDQFA